MVDILLYFGSFNPIHRGHTGIAKYVIEQGFAKELWFVVSPQNPFKNKNSLLPSVDRVAMARIAISALSGVKVCELELYMSQPSYTIDTLMLIAQQNKGKKLGLLIGGDNLPTLDKWKDVQGIISMCDLFVYPRGEQELRSDKFSFTALYDAPLFDVSSTQIREMMTKGEDCSEFLDAGVIELFKV